MLDHFGQESRPVSRQQRRRAERQARKGRVPGVPAAVGMPSDLMVEILSDVDAMEMAGGNPLAVVRGYVEVAPEDVPDEEERSRIQQMVAGMDDLGERPQVFRTPGGTYCVLGEATIFIDGDQVSLERKLDLKAMQVAGLSPENFQDAMRRAMTAVRDAMATNGAYLRLSELRMAARGVVEQCGAGDYAIVNKADLAIECQDAASGS